MRAAWYEHKGAARAVLQVGELPIPEPGPGEVRVNVAVSGINPSDTKGRGTWRGQTEMPFPRISPHQDGSGVIDAVGADISGSHIGERVWIYEAQLGEAAHQEAIKDITTALEVGLLHPVAVQRFSLDAIAAAHEAVETGHTAGKVLIDLDAAR
jgi:NADPH2:quinone reductase